MKTKLITVLTALVFLVVGTTPSLARSRPDPAIMVADAVVIRPLCFVATLVGSAFFVVSLPVAATSKSVHEAADSLVVAPAKATFTRPLGDIDALIDY